MKYSAEEKLIEIRHFIEYEIKLAKRRIEAHESDKLPCFNGVDVGFDKAEQLNKNHILFFERMLEILDRQ